MKGQGSLEYLIIVAAVLAIGAVVVLFLTGAFGSTQNSAKFNECKNAAAQCKSSHLLSPADPCYICDTSCTDAASKDLITGAVIAPNTPRANLDHATAVYLCSQGSADKIFPGGGGGGTGGATDTTKPIITADSISPNPSTVGQNIIQTISATDNVGLKTIEFVINGASQYTCTITGTTASCTSGSSCTVTNNGAAATCTADSGATKTASTFTYSAKVTDTSNNVQTDTGGTGTINAASSTCTNGATQSCTLSGGGSGTQTCTAGAWGTCTASSSSFAVSVTATKRSGSNPTIYDIVATVTPGGKSISSINVYYDGTLKNTCNTGTTCSYAPIFANSDVGTSHTYNADATATDNTVVKDPASGTKSFTVAAVSSSSCTNGAIRTCTTSTVASGAQKCTSNAWSTCSTNPVITTTATIVSGEFQHSVNILAPNGLKTVTWTASPFGSAYYFYCSVTSGTFSCRQVTQITGATSDCQSSTGNPTSLTCTVKKATTVSSGTAVTYSATADYLQTTPVTDSGSFTA